MNYAIKINGKEHYENVTKRLEKLGVKNDEDWNTNKMHFVHREKCHIGITGGFFAIYNHECYPYKLITIQELENIMKKETITSKEPVFKKGDRVFNITYGWRIISEFSICIDGINHYTLEGFSKDVVFSEKTLSFTEYELKGFTQERPIDWNDYIGEWGYLYNSKDDYKCFGKLIAHRGNVTYPFYTNGIWGESWFENFKPLTPELKENLIKEGIVNE